MSVAFLTEYHPKFIQPLDENSDFNYRELYFMFQICPSTYFWRTSRKVVQLSKQVIIYLSKEKNVGIILSLGNDENVASMLKSCFCLYVEQNLFIHTIKKTRKKRGQKLWDSSFQFQNFTKKISDKNEAKDKNDK